MVKSQKNKWILYGAYGFTGKLILDECLKLGLRPTLAGRSISRLRALAQTHELDWRLLSLEAHDQLVDSLSEYSLILNAAGPFVNTAEPLMQACIASGTHYIDISSELSSIQAAYAQSESACDQQVALVPGVGVTPLLVDCLLQKVLAANDELKSQDVSIHVAIDSLRKRSLGTYKSTLNLLTQSGVVYRNGVPRQEALGARVKTLKYAANKRSMVSLPMAELEVLHRHYQFQDIVAFAVQPNKAGGALRSLKAGAQQLLRGVGEQVLYSDAAISVLTPPSPKQRASQRSHAWCSFKNGGDVVGEAMVETIDGYEFTAIAAAQILAVLLATLEEGKHVSGGTRSASELLGVNFLNTLPETVYFGSQAKSLSGELNISVAVQSEASAKEGEAIESESQTS